MWLSIIIPVYNAENYLDKCLNSILCQQLKNVEIIIIDDGSSDNSISKIESYCQNYSMIRLYQNPDNKLSGYSRNKGIEMANGNYLWFIDADDWINPWALKSLLRAVKKRPGTDIFSFGYSEEYSSDDGLWRLHDSLPNNTSNNDYLVNYLLLKKGFLSMPFSYLFKREFIVRNSLRFPEGSYFEDILFMGKAFSLSQMVIWIPEEYYNYNRSNTFSITLHPSRKKIIDLIDMYGQLKNFLLEMGFLNIYVPLLTYRFLIYGLPRCFRMFFRLKNHERRDVSMRMLLHKYRKSGLMSWRSLYRASILAYRTSMGDTYKKIHLSRNLKYLILIKYGFWMLEGICLLKEAWMKFREYILIKHKLFSLQVFNRVPP